MSLIFSEYLSVLEKCKRITTSKDLTKWSAVGHDNYQVYVDQIIIGQFFVLSFKKHQSERYYCFTRSLLKDVHEINEYIEKFMPFGTYDTKNESFRSFTTRDTLDKMLYERGRVIVWHAFESDEYTASIKIEPTNDVNYFMTALTVYITDDARAIYQAYSAPWAITRMLAFLDSDQPSLANYVLRVNQCLNKHIVLPDLSSIVFEFLLIR